MTDITWMNARRLVKDCVDWQKNPRKITDEQLEHLKRSIEKFNYAAPVVIDADGRIVAGHMRCKALRALGRGDEEIDVRVASRKLTEEEFRELAVRDNANGGEFDLTALASFDLDLLAEWGMDTDMVDQVRDRVKEDNFNADEEVAKIETPVTKAGDVYVLGRHRLLCGDATKKEDFEKLMQDKKARLIFTDPPYSVNYKSDSQGSIKNDNLKFDDAIKLYVDCLENLHRFSTDDATLYWWFANKMNALNRQAWEAAGWSMSQVIIWLKETMVFSMGQDYHSCYEPCMLGWKRGGGAFFEQKNINISRLLHA